MACPLLRLALPLALALTVPALQVAIDRLALTHSAGTAAVGSHAIILAAATVVYLLLNGPNVYAVVAVAVLRRSDRAAGTRYPRDVYLLSFGLALLSFALYPFASVLVTPVLGRAPEPTEVVFAEQLSLVVTFLLVQNAALVPALASARVRPAIIGAGAGVLVHGTLIARSLPHLTLADAGAARCWASVVSALIASFFFWAATKHVPPTMPSCRTMREVLRRGAVVGGYTLLGFLSVGVVFFFAMKRCGAGPLGAAALSLGSYALFAALPLAVAQATGILTARATSAADVRNVLTSGVRLAAVFSGTIALGLSAFAAINHAANGSAELSLALLGA